MGFALDSVVSVNKLYPAKKIGIGTYSFSVFDPDGIEVEFTYHPPM